MQLNTRPDRRYLVVEREARPTFAMLRRRMLEDVPTDGDFSVLTAPLPAHDRTWVRAIGNDKITLIGIAALDTLIGGDTRPKNDASDSFEIIVNPFNDDIGFYQYIFPAVKETTSSARPAATQPHHEKVVEQAVQLGSHLPYPENHSSRGMPLPLRRFERRVETFDVCKITGLRCHWLFAQFATTDLFQQGDVCAFNAARDRAYLMEFSSWNYCGGNGAPDARSLGRMYRFRAPIDVTIEAADLRARKLELTGLVTKRAAITFNLIDPLGQPVPLRRRVDARAGRWRVTADLPRHTGRYRLVPKHPKRAIEPGSIGIDVPSTKRRRSFAFGVTNDPPMSIYANHHAPDRLDREMSLWRDVGVSRIQWIEYGRWPSFWRLSDHGWSAHHPKTARACGDLLTAAANTAHRNHVKLFPSLKVFDLGFNCFFTDPDGKSTAFELENRHVSVIPEIAENRQWTMQADPQWTRPLQDSVKKIRLYSTKPLPKIKRNDVTLLVSNNNKRYTQHRGRFVLRQGTIRRPHQRWTPAGNVKDRGTQKNDYIELDGLQLTHPYAMLRFDLPGMQFVHRGHMIAEAFDAQGNAAPLTIATNGDAKNGLFFWKGWGGWNNHNERLFEERTWEGDAIGMVFRELEDMPAILEPAYEGTRNIWLGRVRAMLDAGVDGVDIRTYCHHMGSMHYLKYAFAAPVRETFISLHGRPPRCDVQDYQRIREIRGDFYSQFIQDAAQLIHRRGKKVIVQLESGIDVPAHLDVRMHLPLQWRRWIEEGWVDEVQLKWLTAQSTFAHEKIMPVAHRHGVPVHLVTRCLHQGVDVRTEETARCLATSAADAGFAGLNLYEHQNLMVINPAGMPVFKGPVARFLRAAQSALTVSR